MGLVEMIDQWRSTGESKAFLTSDTRASGQDVRVVPKYGKNRRLTGIEVFARIEPVTKRGRGSS